MQQRLYALALVTTVGCTTSSPLVESSPQIELSTNPGHVAGQPPFELTLTTWNHLAALGDAVDANQLVATLDGASLAIDSDSTGYFGNDDRYVAAFTAPIAQLIIDTTATVSISDQQTTWAFQATKLMTNDLAPVSAMTAGQANTVTWPSAGEADQPSTTIEWACVQVADRTAACLGNGASDPGIDIAEHFITVDVPASAGDPYTVSAARSAAVTEFGDGPQVFVTVLDQVTGVFE